MVINEIVIVSYAANIRPYLFYPKFCRNQFNKSICDFMLLFLVKINKWHWNASLIYIFIYYFPSKKYNNRTIAIIFLFTNLFLYFLSFIFYLRANYSTDRRIERCLYRCTPLNKYIRMFNKTEKINKFIRNEKNSSCAVYLCVLFTEGDDHRINYYNTCLYVHTHIDWVCMRALSIY